MHLPAAFKTLNFTGFWRRRGAMKDSLLPVADSKTNNGFLRSACSRHVMTLMAKLALLSTAATAIGLYCFQSDIFLSSPDLTQILSNYTVGSP